MAVELSHAQGGRQQAEPEAHGVVLVGNEKEEAVGEERPDKDVGHDSGSNSNVGHHDGAVPVEGHKCPGERARDNGDVDKARVRGVAEGERREIEEVDNEDNLCWEEVGTHKEHHKGKVEEVVEDKMRATGAGGVDLADIASKEVEDVADLRDKQNDAGDGVCLSVIFEGRER